MRRRGHADRARRPSPRCSDSRARARSLGPRRTRGRRPRGRVLVFAATERHRREHRRVRRRGAPRDARERRRRAAAVQLHPARDRAHRPARDRDLHRRRLPRARQAHQARDRRAVRRALRAARGAAQRGPRLGQGHVPTYQDRKEFFEGIVNGDPDPIALLRAGDERAVRELIAARSARLELGASSS